MTTLVTTITETLRYRGNIGQWSWVLHRLSGLGIVIFLGLHVVDTSWAAFYPDLYAEAIAQYQSPLFTVGEFILVAAVVYHAMNGLRVAYLDYRPHLWHKQHEYARLVFAATVIILVPTFFFMASHVVDFWSEDPEFASISEILEVQVQFLIGFIAIVAGGLVLSFVAAMVEGKDDKQKAGPSKLNAWMWTFMRWSGVLIIPLVFGHLLMIHLISGVFDITAADVTVVGTTATNTTGTAVEFVGDRWDHLVAGVAVWRIYDAALLALVVIHGFNGVRHVVNDFAHDRVVNRGLNWAIVFLAGLLIILGSAALIAGVEETAADIAHEKLDGQQLPVDELPAETPYWLGG